MNWNKFKKDKITLDRYINLAMLKEMVTMRRTKFLVEKEILLPLLIYQVFLGK